MSGAGDYRCKALLCAVAARDLASLQAALSAPAGAPQLVFQGLPALHVAALRDWAPGVTALLGAGVSRCRRQRWRVCCRWVRAIVASAPLMALPLEGPSALLLPLPLGRQGIHGARAPLPAQGTATLNPLNPSSAALLQVPA